MFGIPARFLWEQWYSEFWSSSNCPSYCRKTIRVSEKKRTKSIARSLDVHFKSRGSCKPIFNFNFGTCPVGLPLQGLYSRVRYQNMTRANHPLLKAKLCKNRKSEGRHIMTRVPSKYYTNPPSPPFTTLPGFNHPIQARQVTVQQTSIPHPTPVIKKPTPKPTIQAIPETYKHNAPFRPFHPPH